MSSSGLIVKQILRKKALFLSPPGKSEAWGSWACEVYAPERQRVVPSRANEASNQLNQKKAVRDVEFVLKKLFDGRLSSNKHGDFHVPVRARSTLWIFLLYAKRSLLEKKKMKKP